MTDLNNNLYLIIKNIFFKTKKIFFLNLISFTIIFAVIFILQQDFQKKKNNTYKHTIVVEDVPITPRNENYIKSKNYVIELKLLENKFLEDGQVVYDVYGRVFSNKSTEILEITRKIENLVQDNINRNIAILEREIDFYRDAKIYEPRKEFETLNQIRLLNKVKIKSNYSIERNGIDHNISRSLILAFIIILILRLFFLEFFSNKKNKL